MPASEKTNFRHVVFTPLRQRFHAAINFAPGCQVNSSGKREIDVSDEDAWFTAWSLRQVGINANMYRPGTLQRRLRTVFRSLHVPSAALAKSVLQSDPHLLPGVVDLLLVGVTSFFRDADVFAALESRMNAELDQRSGGLSVMSVGCASGAELYSVAMLLDERGRLQDSTLLGMDCRPGAIAAAQAGRFSADCISAVTPHRLSKYFKPDQPRWCLGESMRKSCQWKCASAMEPIEARRWDIILCRNMASYMTPEAATGLWRRLEMAIRPGGLLVVGRTERPIGAMRLKLIEPCLYQRTGDL